MALTKVAGDILDPGIVVAGIVTATGFSGPLSDGTTGSFSGDVTVGGNLTVNGTTTTLDSVLTEVDQLLVAANNTTVGAAITQSGSGGILRLFDSATQVFSVEDGGAITASGSITANNSLTVAEDVTIKNAKSLYLANDAENKSARIYNSAGTGAANLTFMTVQSGGSEATALSLDPNLNATFGSTLTIPSEIIHSGDTDTKIFFGTNSVTVATAGQNNVGIGTNLTTLKSPSGTNTTVRLQHQGNSGYGDIILDRQVNAFIIDNDPSNASNHASYFSVRNKGNTNLYVKNDGKIGINTTNPNSALEVQGDGGTNDATITFTRWGTPGNGGVIGSNFYRIGTDSVAGIGAYRESAMDDAYLAFHTQPTGGNFTERLRITSEGNIGVGNDASFPIYTDTNDRNFILGTGSDDAAIQLHSGTDKYGGVYFGDSTSGGARYRGYVEFKHGTNDDYLRLASGGNERLRIDKDGHLLPGAAGTQNLGSATLEWGDLYFANSKGLKLGSSQVGDLYNDGTDTYFRNSVSNGQTLIRSGGNIWISDYAGNHRAAFRDNSAVDLYFDIENHSTAKLSTTATGISVHGEVAASQDYPNIRPTLDFNFAAVKKLDPRIVYERTGAASYTDEFGKVVLVGSNTPRFDHDPLTGECKGLLIEESRTNVYASSDAGASVWTVDGSMTKEANTTDTKDPAGTYTACKLMSAASANSHSQIFDTLGLGHGGVQSFWAKKGTHNVIGIFDYSGGSGIRGWFDLNTGEHRCEGGSKVAAGLQSEGNDTNDTWMIEYPNGWYRCIYYQSKHMTYNHTRICDFDSDTESSSSSNSVYLWGLQAEANNVTFATSHIPCNTGLMPGTVTRGADLAYIDGQDFTDAYNVPEGTFVLKQSVDDTSTSNQWGWGVEKSTNRSGFLKGLGFRVGGGGAGYVGAWYVNNGSQQAFFNMDAGATVNIPFVSALAYKVNDMAATTSGMTVATDTSASIVDPGEFDRFVLGGYHYDTMSTGHIQRVMYYKKRLPNTQLVTLTS